MFTIPPRLLDTLRDRRICVLVVAGALLSAGVAQSQPTQVGTPSQSGHVFGLRGYLAGSMSVVQWHTGPEAGSVSFRLERVRGGRSVPVHQEWIAPPTLAPTPTTYRVLERRAAPGTRARYVLVERSIFGGVRVHGPFRVHFDRELPAEPPFTPPVQVFETLGVEPPPGPHTEDVVPDPTFSTTVAKAFVPESGLYRVTSLELATALGQTVSRIETYIDRGTLRVRSQGSEVAWMSSAGGTEILFFAAGFDSFYTTENVYWIELGETGQQIPIGSAPAATASVGGVFQSAARAEEDQVPAISVTKFEGVDFWYWTGLRAEDPVIGRLGFPLHSPDVATGGGTASLKVRLAGATKGSGHNNHHAVIYVNGTHVGDMLWIGLLSTEQTVSFDASLLTTDNIIEVEAVLDGTIGSAFFVDWFELDYPRYYRPADGALLLRADTNPTVTVEDLPGADIVVLNLGIQAVPVLYSDALIEPQGGGQYRASFAPDDLDALHIVTTLSAVRQTSRVVADAVRSNPTVFLDGADYVVIAPESLVGPAGRLAELRQADGFVSYVLTLEDLYDSFSHGIADPWAVQDFLIFADSNWSLVPRYVVFAGTGTYDPKDYLGFGDNLFSTVFAATPYGMAAADNLLADIDGDRKLDVPIGRIPVRTAEEFDLYIDKVAAFEAASGAWLNEAMMLADNPDTAGDFTTQSETAAGHLPAEMDVARVYLEYDDVDTARTAMFAGFDGGKRVINYFGHGGVELLASEELLTTADGPVLQDTGMPAVVSALTCVAGRFEYPGIDSVSEALVKVTNGGAVTLWAPTSPSLSGAALGLSTDYFDRLFVPGNRVGDAVVGAIDAAGPTTIQFLLETYTLMGDPAVRVQ